MAKDLEMGYLLDFYGEVLTEKQREMLRQYYNDDLSLSEIGENFGITRQGVCGNDSLVKELENGTFEEVKDALEVCFSMMDISAFQCVSSMRNVSMLAARPKQ